MAKKIGLNKGLDALLGDLKTFRQQQQGQQEGLENHLVMLSLHCIHPDKTQPRQFFDEEKITELAQSIQSQGLLQPIVVRPIHSNASRLKKTYQIIAGERRFRACQKLKLEQVPCLIKEVGDQVAQAMSLIENIQRQDLNALELAKSYQAIAQKFNFTHQQIAQMLGCSRVHISNTIRLLKLSDKLIEDVEHNRLEAGHARALISLDKKDQEQAAKKVIAQGLSVRQTEKLVAQSISNSFSEKGTHQAQAEANQRKELEGKTLEKDYQNLQSQLKEALNTQVEFQLKKDKKAGVLKIHFSSIKQLNDLTLKFIDEL